MAGRVTGYTRLHGGADPVSRRTLNADAVYVLSPSGGPRQVCRSRASACQANSARSELDVVSDSLS